MPLKLSLAKSEKLIVNGAVIRNDGEHANLVFENQAQILRQKDILTNETASTPAARVYFALQCAYLFPEREEPYLESFRELLNDYVDAAPSATEIADDVREKVAAEQIYQALKSCIKLIRHEREVLAHAV